VYERIVFRVIKVILNSIETSDLVKENRLNIPLHEHPSVCVLHVTYL